MFFGSTDFFLTLGPESLNYNCFFVYSSINAGPKEPAERPGQAQHPARARTVQLVQYIVSKRNLKTRNHQTYLMQGFVMSIF